MYLKIIFCFAICTVFIKRTCCQEEYPAIEEQLEVQAESGDEVFEDDSWMEQLAFLKRHPININTAVEPELAQLLVLSPMQISNLLRYRLLMGPLIHVNELQAVPGWTPELIRKLLPFITVANQSITTKKLWERIAAAQKTFLFRYTQQFKSDKPGNYLGPPQHVLLKYQFNYGKLLQLGLLLEKDAGEPWLVNKSSDFTSFHFFIREIGIVKAFAVGDFQLNMGQGLIQWQGMSTKKSGNALMIKRQDALLKPYRSAGEANFHRGIALAIGKGRWEWMSYVSVRKFSANVITDSVGGSFVTSIVNSGYHRTVSEMDDRNKLVQVSTGASICYNVRGGRIAMNAARFNFSLPFQKSQEPYDLFALAGKTLRNYSIDYSYTFRNLHLFGEFAVDQRLNKACLNGLLVSLDKRLDLSLLFRSISPSYTSINANAFTENSAPNNETGLYTGVALRPAQHCKVEAYADFFYSRWLRYRVDAPSLGSDFLLQCSWTPNKRFSLYARWKLENKEENSSIEVYPIATVISRQRKTFRAHLSWDCSRTLSLRKRWETSFYNNNVSAERGALFYTDLLFHPPFKPYGLSARLLCFETDGYNSRIYSYEKNVLNAFSVPFFSGKGLHASLNVHFDCNKNKLARIRWIGNKELGLWLNLSHTVQLENAQEPVNTTWRRNTVFRFQIILR